MALVMLLGAAINGPSEEIYWPACLEDAGQAAKVSQKKRLVLGICWAVAIERSSAIDGHGEPPLRSGFDQDG